MWSCEKKDEGLIGLQHAPSYFVVSHSSIPERFLQRKGVICEGILSLSFQLFKSLHVQLEMRRKQLEQSLQSTQRDGILTVDQALVKQAWERVSNTVREASGISRILEGIWGMHYCFSLVVFILASELAPAPGQVPACSSRYGGSLVAWGWRSTATRGHHPSSTRCDSQHCPQSSRAP